MCFTFLRLSVICFTGGNTEVCNVWNHIDENSSAAVNTMINSNYSFKRKEGKLMSPQWGDTMEYKGYFNFLPTPNDWAEQDILLYASFCQDVNKKYVP